MIAPPLDTHKHARTRTKLSPLQLRKLPSSSHSEDLKDQDLNLDQDSPYSKSADTSLVAAEHGHPDEVSRVSFNFLISQQREGVPLEVCSDLIYPLPG
jgi:hypothetical protein